MILIKNLLGKKDSKDDPKSDEEVQKLREKFNDIVKSEGDEGKTTEEKPKEEGIEAAKPAQGASLATPVQSSASAQAQQQPPGYQFVDPEKAEENERITNLIMQQISFPNRISTVLWLAGLA